MKSIWRSKTLWFNLLTAGAELAQTLPLPPGTVVVIASVVNIALRLVTTQSVTFRNE